jgi:serine/threonine-protein kinase HipA
VTTALYDFYKLTLLNIRLRNGDAHLKNSGVTYKNLQGLALGEVPAMERRLAPIFDVVSTVPYLPNDTMALSLTGTKRWPKAKVLHRFGLNHCQLSKQQLEQAAEEVDLAINQNLPLLKSLSQQHAGFAAIAERMHAIFIQKPA